MKITITKGAGADRIAILRDDGTRADARVAQKGPVPHDAVHYFAEKGLGLACGFWGMVAAGHDPEDLAGLAKAAGHASATRCDAPHESIVPLLQAERLVECFEADLWAGRGESTALLAMARSGWEASLVPELTLDPTDVDKVRQALLEFACEWMDAPIDHVAGLSWP